MSAHTRRLSPAIGHVYVLISPTCRYIKIGGTDYAPRKRIPEINAVEPYKSLGPWRLHDFRQVTDWRRVEYSLHYAYRSKRIGADVIPRQKELFDLSPVDASARLQALDDSLILRKPKIDRMFQDHDLAQLMAEVFRVTGLLNWLELQGAWTLTLFPSTSGGRYFTLNIGPHEVAFATAPPAGELPVHMLHMDRLVRELPHVLRWVQDHDGQFTDGAYASALARSTSVTFQADLPATREFLRLPGVRRAIIAYWTEALMKLQDSGAGSVYARYHNWNAVAELRRRLLTDKL